MLWAAVGSARNATGCGGKIEADSTFRQTQPDFSNQWSITKAGDQTVTKATMECKVMQRHDQIS